MATESYFHPFGPFGSPTKAVNFEAFASRAGTSFVVLLLVAFLEILISKLATNKSCSSAYFSAYTARPKNISQYSLTN